MLELTLATRFEIGTNVKGNVAGANWSFLLPSLELDQVLCIGSPSAEDLVTLARLARRVLIVGRAPSGGRSLSANVQFVAASSGKLPLNNQCVDLAVLPGKGGAARLARSTALRQEIERVLRPEGLVYVESGRWLDRLGGHRSLRRLAAETPFVQRHWITPLFGRRTATAVPLEATGVREYFLRQGLTCPSARQRVCQSIERRIHRRASADGRWARVGALVGNTSAEQPGVVPRYLREIAAQSGVDLSAYRFGLAAKGRYSSRKVLFYLFPERGDQPRFIVKLTRDSSLNARLENEHAALTALSACMEPRYVAAPKPIFFGHHGGLAILGQTILEGAPFLKGSTLSADCPAVCSAVDWLTDLAAASAGEVSGDVAARAFGALVEQLDRTYHLAPQQRAFLLQQVELVAAAGSMRTVFQHGDPGVWNAWVLPDGRAALLDWEAFESRGAPLWDLFYFWRSLTVQAARRQGVAGVKAAIERNWARESPHAQKLIEAVGEYCRRLDLAEQLVPPLFYLCWVHRAVKESTRLRPEKLSRGTYISMLARTIERRTAENLFGRRQPAAIGAKHFV
jgi:hypothetical protein